MTKTCTKCGETKELNLFRRDNSTKTGYKQPCQKCNLKNCAKWQKAQYATNSEYRKKTILKDKNKNKLVRSQTLDAYGNKCACCGESTPEFLSIDHIFNDGATERKTLKINSGSRFYRWLKKQGFPTDRYQILCHNCNFAKGAYGICPHNRRQI